MLWNYLNDKIKKNGKHFISDFKHVETFGNLSQKACDFAKQLLDYKYGIMCNSDIESARALLACLAAGVTAIPLSNRYGKIHNERIIQTMGIKKLIIDESGFLEIITISNGNNRKFAPDIDKTELKDVALILCTSGTTGKPKGVMLTKNGILQNLKDTNSFFLSIEGDRLYAGRGFYHCSAIMGELFMSLIRGIDIYCYSGVFFPQKMLNLIESYQITMTSGTPTMFYHLCKNMNKNRKCTLRYCNVGGEPMDEVVFNMIKMTLPDTKIIQSYGLTETCSRATYVDISKVESKADCVGGSLKGIKFKILDECGNCIRNHAQGHIFVAGKAVMKGYYRDKKLTESVLQNGWLDTGDIGYIDEFGMLHILGRKDDMIIRAGVKFYPIEIEQILKNITGISQVKVYVELDKVSAKRKLKCIVELEKNCNFQQNNLMNICLENLPAYMMPDCFEIVKSIPISVNGKLYFNDMVKQCSD